MRTRRPTKLLPAACALLCALALGACGAAALAPATRTATSSGAAATCNGLTVVCDRRLNQVVFPATHNSYAASDEPGWHFANQRFAIARQLRDGIRALTLDVHFGVSERGGLVRTDFRAEGAGANKAVRNTPPRALAAAEQIGGRLGAGLSGTTPGLYLCHTLCELGSEPLSAELAVIARFLKQHPRDFLMLIVEDYVPPRYIAAAFKQAELAKLAVTLKSKEQLPTVGKLLGEGKQLAVFSEDHGGKPAWYMKAFKFIQDTPLGARRPTQLSCNRARGEPNSPLLLINYWIPPFPPSPRLNAEIGRRRFLRHRVTRCMTARDSAGAIVAVDFYQRSSVIAVANDLNRSAGG